MTKHCDEKSTVRQTVTENPRKAERGARVAVGNMASERRTEVKTKAATGPPVIAGGYEVPAEAVFARRRRMEVVTRDILVFPMGRTFFYLREQRARQPHLCGYLALYTGFSSQYATGQTV